MKVGVVGAGLVGSTAAYAMVMHGVGREIVLVDQNAERAAAEANDITHAVPFAHPLRIRAGGYDALQGCQAVVIGAGVNQQPGETRLELLKRNAAVFADVVPSVIRNAREAVLVIATNPVDIMTHIATKFAEEAGLPPHQVLGSGTTLDTARFRSLLGNYCDVDSHHVHAYVVGEHGDSEVLTWSLATIAGTPLSDFTEDRGVPLGDAQRDEIDRQVRSAAYEIIAGKKATYYGIGSALSRIVETILHNQRSIMTVCSRMQDLIPGAPQVTLSVPHIVGGHGIVDRIPLDLSSRESSELQTSATIIQEAIESL